MAKADKPEKNNKKQKHFWKDFKAELKKVIWPTRSQVINNTIIVIVIVAIVTAICFVLDLSFEALNTYGINKLKSVVQENVSKTVEDEKEGEEQTESEEDNAEETAETEEDAVVDETNVEDVSNDEQAEN